MAKTGRNDPCYCGSGRKYKHCHWESDQAAVRSRLNTRRARQSLFSRLYDFAQRERFQPDFRAAFDLFWDRRRKADQRGSLTPAEATRFFEWYLIEYRTSHDRQRIIDMFRAQGAGYITPEERAYLGAWQSAQLSLYEARELLGDGSAALQDLLRDEALTVRDEDFLGGMKQGDLVLARTVQLAEHNEFILSVTAIPAEHRESIVEFARAKYRLYADAHFNATWGDFLRASGYLLNHFLLDSAGDSAPVADAVATLGSGELLKPPAGLSVPAAR